VAAGYALAWAFTQIPYIIFLIVPESSSTSVVSVFDSLQGLYNFFVCMFPKVWNSKKCRNSHDITWYNLEVKEGRNLQYVPILRHGNQTHGYDAFAVVVKRVERMNMKKKEQIVKSKFRLSVARR
jgi:hypothetical protein